MNSLSQTLVEYIARYPYQDHPAFQKRKPEEPFSLHLVLLRYRYQLIIILHWQGLLQAVIH